MIHQSRELSHAEIGQIRADYRQAKDKGPTQIQILADLNDCTKQNILDALGLDEMPMKKQRSKPHSYDDAFKKQFIKAVLADGEPMTEAAKRFGVAYGTASKWVERARMTQGLLGGPEPQPIEKLKSFAEVEADQVAAESVNTPAEKPAEELPQEGQAAEPTRYNLRRLMQVKAGLHCCTELMDMRSSVPDGYLVDLHDLLVEILDEEIDKLEVVS